MFRIITHMQPLSIIKPEQTRKWYTNITKFALVPTVFATAFYYYKMKEVPIICEEERPIVIPKEEETSKIRKFVTYLIRFIELSFIFLPSMFLLPLCLFDTTREFWLSVFLSAIKRAGFVWIKAFQYFSHRRDIIG